MDAGFLLPYLLLILVLLEEHYAVWVLFFFVIPMLDIMFYVEIPDKKVINNYWCRVCMWMWFPMLFYTAYVSGCSLQSMLSMGVLYNSSLCLADELEKSGEWHNKELGYIINDHLGYARLEHFTSVLRSFGFFHLMLLHDKLLWHLGSVFIGSLIYKYVCWVETKSYNTQVSPYGIANYTMFRLKHTDKQLLPISHMWVFLYMSILRIASYFDLDDD